MLVLERVLARHAVRRRLREEALLEHANAALAPRGGARHEREQPTAERKARRLAEAMVVGRRVPRVVAGHEAQLLGPRRKQPLPALLAQRRARLRPRHQRQGPAPRQAAQGVLERTRPLDPRVGGAGPHPGFEGRDGEPGEARISGQPCRLRDHRQHAVAAQFPRQPRIAGRGRVAIVEARAEPACRLGAAVGAPVPRPPRRVGPELVRAIEQLHPAAEHVLGRPERALHGARTRALERARERVRRPRGDQRRARRHERRPESARGRGERGHGSSGAPGPRGEREPLPHSPRQFRRAHGAQLAAHGSAHPDPRSSAALPTVRCRHISR